MLPFHGVPVARRGCLAGLQQQMIIEGRPVMDDPGSLLPGYEATLDFKLRLDEPAEEGGLESQAHGIVGRYESQVHVTVTEVRWSPWHPEWGRLAERPEQPP
jgi:hypothetical protein